MLRAGKSSSEPQQLRPVLQRDAWQMPRNGASPIGDVVVIAAQELPRPVAAIKPGRTAASGMVLGVAAQGCDEMIHGFPTLDYAGRNVRGNRGERTAPADHFRETVWRQFAGFQIRATRYRHSGRRRVPRFAESFARAELRRCAQQTDMLLAVLSARRIPAPDFDVPGQDPKVTTGLAGVFAVIWSRGLTSTGFGKSSSRGRSSRRPSREMKASSATVTAQLHIRGGWSFLIPGLASPLRKETLNRSRWSPRRLPSSKRAVSILRLWCTLCPCTSILDLR